MAYSEIYSFPRALSFQRHRVPGKCGNDEFPSVTRVSSSHVFFLRVIIPAPSRTWRDAAIIHFHQSRGCHRPMLFGIIFFHHKHCPQITPPMSTSGFACVCKRSFTAQNYLSQHQRSCSQTRKRLSSAISSFKDFFRCRKKPRISNDGVGPACNRCLTR